MIGLNTAGYTVEWTTDDKLKVWMVDADGSDGPMIETTVTDLHTITLRLLLWLG